MDLLVCQDEFGCGYLPVVDEKDNQSRDQQCGDDDSCENCAFGHGFVVIVDDRFFLISDVKTSSICFRAVHKMLINVR